MKAQILINIHQHSLAYSHNLPLSRLTRKKSWKILFVFLIFLILYSQVRTGNAFHVNLVANEQTILTTSRHESPQLTQTLTIDLLPKWVFTANNSISSSVVIFDYNGDQNYDIVVTSLDSNVYILSADGALEDYVIMPNKLVASPRLHENNGQNQLVIVTINGIIEILDGSNPNNVLASHNLGVNIQGSPTLGDINQDGIDDILIGGGDGKIYALDGTDLHLLWSFTTGGAVYGSIAVSDVNNDNQIELIFGSSDGHIYALTSNGYLLWQRPTGYKVTSTPVLADIDNDGTQEVIATSQDGSLYVIDSVYGSIKWQYNSSYIISSSPAIADINGDGNPEIVFGNNQGKLISLNVETHNENWEYIANSPFLSTPSFADLNGDHLLDVIIGNNDGNLYVFDGRTGSIISKYPTQSPILSASVIYDIDKDGYLEILIANSEGNLYALESSTPGSVFYWIGDGGDYSFKGTHNLKSFDADNDFLSDFGEIVAHSNAFSNDTEHDGMPDGYEYYNSLNPLSSDQNEDQDNDNLANIDEYQAHTYANNADTDQDGLPDGWEVYNHLNPILQDQNQDPDQDALINKYEYILGTNPVNPDTDNDGMPDGWEVYYGLHPTNQNDAALDNDLDGLINVQEYKHHTNPNNKDTDGDGVNDYYEVMLYSNPTNKYISPLIYLAIFLAMIAIIVIIIKIKHAKKNRILRDKARMLRLKIPDEIPYLKKKPNAKTIKDLLFVEVDNIPFIVNRILIETEINGYYDLRNIYTKYDLDAIEKQDLKEILYELTKQRQIPLLYNDPWVISTEETILITIITRIEKEQKRFKDKLQEYLEHLESESLKNEVEDMKGELITLNMALKGLGQALNSSILLRIANENLQFLRTIHFDEKSLQLLRQNRDRIFTAEPTPFVIAPPEEENIIEDFSETQTTTEQPTIPLPDSSIDDIVYSQSTDPINNTVAQDDIIIPDSPFLDDTSEMASDIIIHEENSLQQQNDEEETQNNNAPVQITDPEQLSGSTTINLQDPTQTSEPKDLNETSDVDNNDQVPVKSNDKPKNIQQLASVEYNDESKESTESEDSLEDEDLMDFDEVSDDEIIFNDDMESEGFDEEELKVIDNDEIDDYESDEDERNEKKDLNF